MPISLIPNLGQFSYEADFSPPIVEVLGSPKQVEFIRKLAQAFNIKLAQITVTPQNLGRGYLFFSLWPQDPGSSFSVSIGGDGVSVTYFKPPSRESAWEPVDKLLGALSDSVPVRCEKQSLKFHGHSAPLEIKPDELISKFNVYENEMLISKGVNFTFKGPQENSQTFVVISNSLFIQGGIYLLFDITYSNENHLTRKSYDVYAQPIYERIFCPVLDWNW